jgi:hypothetical protein
MRRDKNGSLDKVVAVLRRAVLRRAVRRRAVRRRRDNEGDGKGLLSPSPCGEGEVGTGQPDIVLCGVVQVSNRIDFGG